MSALLRACSDTSRRVPPWSSTNSYGLEHSCSATVAEKTGGVVQENTITVRLIGLLKERGLPGVDFEQHFPILRGRPRKPDAAFAHNGTNLISAKLGAGKEAEAISSAQSYQTLIGESTILGDVFAVVYPKAAQGRFTLWVLANSRHDVENWTEPSLELVADRIANVVNGVYVGRESKTASAKRVLSLAVSEVSDALTGVERDRLKAVFGGREFFDSVLAYQIGPEEEEGALRAAAGYLLVNQVLFYEVLSRHLPLKYPAIPTVDPPDPKVIWSNYFALVLEKDYRPIFEVDVSSCLEGQRGNDGLFKVVNSIRALVPGLEQREIMGDVFHELIPLTFRKPLGAYFTNRRAAELLARLSVDEAGWKVMDPACGSGTLLVAAYRQKRELYSGPLTAAEVHKQFVERDLVGIDVMAFVAHLAAVHLAIQEPLEDTDRVQIGVDDSTRKVPGDKLQETTKSLRELFRQRTLTATGETGLSPTPSGIGVFAVKGSVGLGRSQAPPFVLDHPNIVITNPPFTSCNNMATAYRRQIEGSFSGSSLYTKALAGRWSLQVPFLLLADRFLEPGGRIAAVLPFTTFSGKYFEPLVDLLLTKYSVKYIVAGVHGCAFSDDTHLTEILLVADKRPADPDHKFKLIGLKRGPHSWTEEDYGRIRNLVRALRSGVTPAADVLAVVRDIPQASLGYRRERLPKLVADLTRSFAAASDRIDAMLTASSAVATIKEVLERNHWQIFIGKAFRVFKDAPDETGHGLHSYGGAAIMASSAPERAKKAHDRFVVVGRSSNWVELEDLEQTGTRFRLPAYETIGYLRRFAGVDRLDASRVVDLTVRRYSSHVEPLLKHVYGDDSTSKVQTLKRDWKEKVDADQAHLLIAYKSRIVAPGTRLIAARSTEPVFVAGDVYGVRGTSKSDEEILTLWFNSTPFLLSLLANRTVTTGPWGRLDKKILERMPLMDPRKLTADQTKRITTAYRELANVQWPSILEQYRDGFPPRKLLDRAIMTVIAPNRAKGEELLSRMTKAASEHLEGLASAAKSEAAAI